MSVAVQPSPATAVRDSSIPDVPIYRLSVAQYRAMAEAGILGEEDAVELLAGWLVPKMTLFPPHALATGLLQDALTRLLPHGWFLKVQDAIDTPDSAPEPDLAVARGARRDYAHRHPGPADLALVVEVSESSLRQDQGVKKRLYAFAGISIYWIVNLVERRIEVYSQPSGPTDAPEYGQRRNFGPGESVPLLIDGDEIGSLAVDELLP